MKATNQPCKDGRLQPVREGGWNTAFFGPKCRPNARRPSETAPGTVGLLYPSRPHGLAILSCPDRARFQRRVLFGILFGLISYILGMLLGQSASTVTPALFFLFVALIVVPIYNARSVYRLASALKQEAFLYAVCMFIPCIGLIALLQINQQATNRLTSSGIRVGLLGAQEDTIQ